MILLNVSFSIYPNQRAPILAEDYLCSASSSSFFYRLSLFKKLLREHAGDALISTNCNKQAVGRVSSTSKNSLNLIDAWTVGTAVSLNLVVAASLSSNSSSVFTSVGAWRLNSFLLRHLIMQESCSCFSKCAQSNFYRIISAWSWAHTSLTTGYSSFRFVNWGSKKGWEAISARN